MRAQLVHVVFEGNRYAGKRAHCVEGAVRYGGIHGSGLLKRKLVGYFEECMHVGVDGDDARKSALGNFARREFLGTQACLDFAHAHGCKNGFGGH